MKVYVKAAMQQFPQILWPDQGIIFSFYMVLIDIGTTLCPSLVMKY